MKRPNHSSLITMMRRAERHLTEKPDFAKEIRILDAMVFDSKPGWNAATKPRVFERKALGPYRVEGDPIAVEGDGA
jgi:hypothetical protein